MRNLTVGLDIGGTKTEALVVDAHRTICGEARRPTAIERPTALLDSITTTVDAALQAAGASRGDIAQLGVGIPGHVNRQTGEVQLAVNLGLTAYPLGEALATIFSVPVQVENDARLAALGVHHYLYKASLSSLAYLSVGTGISAGVILDGRLHRGVNGMAGEIGHIVIASDGPACACGQHGCLEALAAGPAILAQGQQALPEATINHAGDVYHLAGKGDTAAGAVVREVSRTLAHALQWLVLGYDVEKVVIGGGVAGIGALFFDPILAELDHLRRTSALAAMMLPATRFELLPANFNAGAWGAAWLAQQEKAQTA